MSELDLRDRGGRIRVGLLSDTHGVLDAGVARRLQGCEVVLHAGDVGADAVLAALAGTGAFLLAVRGNNDTSTKWQGAGAMPVLPVVARLRLPGGDIAVEHGDAHPPGSRHRRLRAAHTGARAVLYGHSHRLLVDRDTYPWVLNPGAAGRARTFGGASCLLLHVAGERWRITAWRSDGAVMRRVATR